MANFSLGVNGNGDEVGSSRPFHRLRRGLTFLTPDPKRMRSAIDVDSDSEEDRGERDPSPDDFIEREWSPNDRGHGDESPEYEAEILEEDEEEYNGDHVVVNDHVVAGDVAHVAANGGEPEEGHSMTLSDPDVLDCPICLSPLTVPVFQCENGHITCSSCSTKVRSRCPSCTLPIGYNRCRAIEKVIESVKISCRNSRYGCLEKISYCNKSQHNAVCAFAPLSCPKQDCTFMGSLDQLSRHFTILNRHFASWFCYGQPYSVTLPMSQKYLVLKESDGRLFILNRKEFESLGSLVNISCIQPSTSTEKFQYTLCAKKHGCVVKLESVADNVAARTENPDQSSFLMVPRGFLDSYGKLELEVTISK